MKKRIAAAIACVLIAGFFYSGYQVWRQGSEYVRGSSAYSALNACVSVPEKTEFHAHQGQAPSQDGAQLLNGMGEKEYDYPEIVWPEVDFERLKAINPEIVGWLYAEGMGLNYPVVQTGDNKKYLDTMFDGVHNKTGCPFLDAGNSADFSDRHSVIYAHNRKDGSMFGQLDRYKEQDFYRENPRILLMTEDARYVMEIFSGHVARSDSGAWKIGFSGNEEFVNWKKVIGDRSSIDTGLQPGPDERILTLSTCSYEFDQARYVLHGVLRRARMPSGK